VRLVITVNQDWFFLSHRLPIARAARDAGAHVLVVAGDSGKGTAIRAEGFEFIALPIARRGLNPIQDLRTLWFLKRTYQRLRPKLVHHVTIKPVLYGSIAARLVGGIAVVNAVSGLGYAFMSRDRRARAIRPFVRALYRIALGRPNSRTIFQNPDDLSDVVKMGAVQPRHAVLIRGAGVDCARFRPAPEPSGLPIVLLASRMLWDKGVKEFVEAAGIIRGHDKTARFVLVGAPDVGNPSAIPVEQLEAWTREGVVEWWGQRDDMPEVLAQASVVALPTLYGEGVPKVLLEAAASGRPIVATDVRGCREIVRPGVNGLLVAPRNSMSLADALRDLLSSPELRMRLGRAGREIALAEFAEEGVVERTLGVYRELLGGPLG
jgi:glycosyltransferase involved in cell wall biosynthesis